jgi:hypothetical protein
MFTFILGYVIGSFVTFIGIMGYVAYHYYKTWNQAYEEGWDMPN